MCGFIGYIYDQEKQVSNTEIEALRERMSMIEHRGPDDEGVYSDSHVRLGFKRLSIVDLDKGKQPLSFENERYHIIFNGEVYNHPELKEALVQKGYTFQTHSDTEVVLALYHDKKQEMVNELRGMFAFVIWDKLDQLLFAARDPFGIKPFYYLEEDGVTTFASEKKAIINKKEQSNNHLSHHALQHYMTFQYVPEPLSMSNIVKKLEPGHYLMKSVGQPLTTTQYWAPTFQPILRDNRNDYIQQIRDALSDSVEKHLRSDVPVGAFLSSGIDSTSIVALAKEIHPDIKTFTVGFERDGYSEIDIAKRTADQLGVTHHSKTITPETFIKELPHIVSHMDEPVADPAAIPLYFVAKEASQHVKVVLSGEGADELFGGYNIYREPGSLKGFDLLPKFVKDGLNKAADYLPDNTRGKSFIQRGCTDLADRYIGNAKIYSEAEKERLLKHYDKHAPYTTLTHPYYEQIKTHDKVTQMQYIDIHTWLRGDILVKADLMTMASSLELRVPFLDKKVFEVASQLPTHEKITNGTTKFVLREAMEGIIPNDILMQKKLGFPVPIKHWLKNELYDWALSIINHSPTQHIFNKPFILKQLEEHRTSKKDNSRELWTVLIFMIWHQLFIEQDHPFVTQHLNHRDMLHNEAIS